MTTYDITEAIPSVFTARTTSTAATDASVAFDVVIGGIGFVYAIDEQHPYRRQTVPTQKQQIDTSGEAGEQTLDGLWVRSQTSWHHGAGADFYEPSAQNNLVPTQYRFKDSRGVDVWDTGRLKLLPAVASVGSTASTAAVCGARLSSGEDVWYSRLGDTVYRHHSGGPTSHGTAAYPLTGGRMCAAGSTILLGGTRGIHSTPLETATITLIADQGSTGTLCQPYWVKSRIVVTQAEKLHVVPLAGATIDATSLHWTHPDSGWTWTGVVESPDAVIASGYWGGVSSLYAMTLTEDTAGSYPALSQPFHVADLPPGEEIRCIKSYLGKYLGIGTSAGVRVGLIGTGGQVQYGPLIVETADPVVDLGARDSYLYAATGNSVIRVNLAESIDGGLRFPYAYDVEIPSGETISWLGFDGVTDRVVMSADTVGTYAASTTDYVSSGWLESGQIRYGTTAPKGFRTVDVDASSDSTTAVAVSTVVNSTTTSLVTLSDGKSGLDIGLGSLPSPLAQVGYKLTLTASSTTTPEVQAVAVKAVPVPKRQRQVQYPLWCADRTRDSNHVPFGHDGYATTLLEALEALENSQSIVTVIDKTRPEQFEATIDSVGFDRVEGRRGGRDNFGGIVTVTVRSL